MSFEKVKERALTRFWILWRNGQTTPCMFSFDKKGSTDAEKGIRDFEARVLAQHTDWLLCLAYVNTPNNQQVLHCYKNGNAYARLPYSEKEHAPYKAYIVFTNLYKYETGKSKGETHYIQDLLNDCGKLWNKDIQRIQIYENSPKNTHLYNYANGYLESLTIKK